MYANAILLYIRGSARIRGFLASHDVHQGCNLVLYCSPSGYRPISLLQILNKELEKQSRYICRKQLASHNPLSLQQWGFSKR